MFTNKELGVISDLLDTFVGEMDDGELDNTLGMSRKEYEQFVAKFPKIPGKLILSLFDGLIELRLFSMKNGNHFELTYGMEVIDEAEYEDITRELGKVILHYLTNEGLMD